MFEEEPEDRVAGVNPPRYKLERDEIRGKREPGYIGHLRP